MPLCSARHLAAAVGVAAVSYGAMADTSTFIDFRSVDGQLLADGEPFLIRGMSWFGGETIERCVQGLWPYATTIDMALDLLSEHGFNALRLPLAMDLVLDDPVVDVDMTAGSPSLAGKSYLEVLDAVIEEAAARNILVLLDSHRIEAAEPDFPDIAVPGDITPALEKLAVRYCNTWNMFAVDLKNEPKGKATWGTGNEDTDWDLAAAKIGNAVLTKCSRLLIFVEGVQANIQGEGKLEWGQAGGSLQGAKAHPVKLENMERLVYSPHLHPPGIDFKSPWWDDSDFPANMPGLWDEYFGFVPEETGQALVVGHWLARMEGRDADWALTAASYLAKNSIGSFYWALNPQSHDTGGFVIDDWVTPNKSRVSLLAPLKGSSLDAIVAKRSACSDTCSGYGVCVEGSCQCFAGWSGLQCETCSEGDSLACNNAGVCSINSTCVCNEGTAGEYCDGVECGGISCGGENAGCFDGVCTCLYNCIGSSCTVCAANESVLLATPDGAAVLCGECEGPAMALQTKSSASASPMPPAYLVVSLSLLVLMVL